LSDTQTKQHLAAILAADAVGYSRLMSADDRATVAALDAARATFRKHIAANQGRVVDMAGDSVLAVFGTAAGAVSAALGTQADIEVAMGELPADQRLLFRIGVHMADVIEKADGTIYGDGVNISARLQALAPAGGVVISDAVRGSVKNRVAGRFVDLGKQSVKNIAEPVRAFKVQTAGAKGGQAVRPHRRWLAAIAVIGLLIIGAGWYAIKSGMSFTASERADAKSIAVLPFASMSDDKDTAYFADGVQEDLLTQLALLGDLKVISRISVMDYRNTKKNVRQIGAELGVASVVEGSVRRAGNQVRITAQLIDTKSDKHLWAKSYDRELKDIFAIQSELATEIARSLKISLEPQDQARLAKPPTQNLEAYELFLRHQQMLHDSVGSIRLAASTRERLALISRVVELDDSFALAWARLAMEYARAYRISVDRSPIQLVKAREAIERARAIAPDDPLVKIDTATYYVLTRSDPAKAAKEYESVLANAPNNAEALAGLANLRLLQLQWAERAALLERALSVDPRNPRVLSLLAGQYETFRRFDKALELRKRLVDLRPDDEDLKVNLYFTEYLRSGSWDAYDKWRRTLPQGAEELYSGVMYKDFGRALSRHDFKEALRLNAIRPADVRTLFDARDEAILKSERAILERAAGDASLSAKTARTAMEMMEQASKTWTDDLSLLTRRAYVHALLGEREAAFAALAKAADTEARFNNRNAELTRRQSAQLHTLLGDRKEALLELSQQLQLPDSQVNELRIDPSLASLWSDAGFLEMVNNPANNAPVSLDATRGLTATK